MKKFVLFVIFFSLTATAAYGGTKEDIEQVQRNLLELQKQFWDLGKELQINSTGFRDVAKELQKSNNELQENQAALSSKLESILNQLQALNEKLDETNQRLRDLGSASYQRPAAPSYNPGNTPESENPNANSVEEPDETAPPRNPPTTGGGTVGEMQLFQDANALYTQGRFEQALRGFQDLLDQYPDSRQSDDAQYMIGECYYGMKEYVDAVSEYDKVIKGFPNSDRVPGARLKKAFSLNALGKKGQAVIEFQQIVQRYPTTKEAQIAKQRLSELGLD